MKRSLLFLVVMGSSWFAHADISIPGKETLIKGEAAIRLYKNIKASTGQLGLSQATIFCSDEDENGKKTTTTCVIADIREYKQ